MLKYTRELLIDDLLAVTDALARESGIVELNIDLRTPSSASQPTLTVLFQSEARQLVARTFGFDDFITFVADANDDPDYPQLIIL